MKLLALFIQPAQFRNQDPDSSRKVTWAELFYDLVFVTAIAALAEYFFTHFSLTGLVQTIMLFATMWYAWLSATFYADRFDTDDAWHRVMNVFQMLCVVGIAVNIHTAFHLHSYLFIVFYVALRSSIVLLYVRVARQLRTRRSAILPIILLMLVILGLWCISLLVAPPWRYAVWLLAIAIDIALPLVLRHRLSATTLPLSHDHLPERFGLFTMIVLGESLASIVHGLLDIGTTFTSLLMALMVLLISFSIWWLYYDNVDDAAMKRPFSAVLCWEYLHFVLLICIMMLSVTIRHIFEVTAAELTMEHVLLPSLLVVIYAILGLFNYLCYRYENVPTVACRYLICARLIAVGMGIVGVWLGFYLSLLWLVVFMTVLSVAQVLHNIILPEDEFTVLK
tara:strand:+ start:20302 stop:21483 length:1182 start_codon:yes stop_codon:yes gene_type:complete